MKIVGRYLKRKYADVVLNLAAHPTRIDQEHTGPAGGYEEIPSVRVAATQCGDPAFESSHHRTSFARSRSASGATDCPRRISRKFD